MERKKLKRGIEICSKHRLKSIEKRTGKRKTNLEKDGSISIEQRKRKMWKNMKFIRAKEELENFKNMGKMN